MGLPIQRAPPGAPGSRMARKVSDGHHLVHGGGSRAQLTQISVVQEASVPVHDRPRSDPEN
eukprot:7505914-Pyramimonas_sp.AAC.1